MTDKKIVEGLVYDENHMPGRPSNPMSVQDLARADATKHWKTHAENHFILSHFHKHGDAKEKIQAAKEMRQYSEPKMKFWSQHPNFDHKEAERFNVSRRKHWAEADARVRAGKNEGIEYDIAEFLDEGSAEAFLKFRAKKAEAAKTDADRVREFLAKNGPPKHHDAKPMSNKLSASKAVVKSQDFDKELRQAAAYLKPKKQVKEDYLLEGADLYCDNCNENLGKATEKGPLAHCGTCGKKTKNPDYDRKAWTPSGEPIKLKEAINPNLAKILAMRNAASVSVAGVQKAKKDKIVSQTSAKNSKEVQTFLDKDGNKVTRVPMGKRNYKWNKGEPIRKPVKEDMEPIDEISKKLAGEYRSKAEDDIMQAHLDAKRARNHNKIMLHIARMNKREAGADLADKKMFGGARVMAKEAATESPIPPRTKTLDQVLEKPARKYHEYRGNTKDEREIINRMNANTVEHPDRNGNGNDVFKAAKIKRATKPVNPGEDEKKYAEWNGDVPVVEETLDEISQATVRSYLRKTDDGRHDEDVYDKRGPTKVGPKKLSSTYNGYLNAMKKLKGGAKVPASSGLKVVEEVNYEKPEPHIPFEDRDGDKHVVVVHTHGQYDSPSRSFLGNGENKNGLHNVHSGNMGGERKAKVFDSRESAHDHVRGLLSKPRDYRYHEMSYSVHPKRTDDAIDSETAKRREISDAEGEKWKSKNPSDHVEAQRLMKTRLNAVHPALRMSGFSAGNWTHHYSEFDHRKRDTN